MLYAVRDIQAIPFKDLRYSFCALNLTQALEQSWKTPFSEQKLRELIPMRFLFANFPSLPSFTSLGPAQFSWIASGRRIPAPYRNLGVERG